MGGPTISQRLLADRFASVWLKLDRANRHINDLHAVTVAYQRTNPHVVLIEDDLEAGQRRYKFGGERHPPPPGLALIAGDAVHNLRSALDHFVWLVTPTHARGLKTAFPVWRKESIPNPRRMQEEVQRTAGGCPERVRQALCAIQPYFGGDGEFIRAVDYLDIVDKHKLVLTLTGSYSLTIDYDLMRRKDFPDGPDWAKAQDPMRRKIGKEWFEHPFPLEVGFTLLTVNLRSPDDQTEELQLAADVAFGEPPVLAGDPVVPTLAEMADRIEHLIKNLIRLL